MESLIKTFGRAPEGLIVTALKSMLEASGGDA
jgi:hypothetical protein